ncbi:NAD(P)/FAD-dependent oxidoreductase [Macrococcus equi]|uniref:NAD(P)/FAD-dependent oxidoreductase n=1 Tax=Macrococcus equi TaxID=3395462 RepID=UPI0039BE9797
MSNLLDITIIGGGPAGLYAAFYAGLRGLKVRIIDQNDTLGGKLNLFPEKIVWDAGGIPPQPASEIMKNLIQQGTTFNPEVILNTVVTDIKKENDYHFIVETDQASYHSKTVIVAVGSGIIKPIKLDIDGAERYEVNNLHYVVPSLKRFVDKRVLISGGGNAAVDWAHDIAPYAKSVHIICRKEDFKGHEETVRQLDDLGVTKITNQTIHSLIAENDEIKQVEIIHNTDNTISTLEVDDVIINHGFHMDCELLNESSVQFERVDDFYIKGQADTSTNTRGIYAIGDILKHDAKVNLIIGCFHDAATSINQIKMYLDPKAASHGIVSSHNPIFEAENEKIKQRLFYN